MRGRPTKSRLVAGWYILLYHDVSWEETPFVRHIGGTCPPDVFHEHILTCKHLGDLVSVQDGFERLISGKLNGPVFSIWFDDGFAGVRKYAAPILSDHDITAAMSVCSRFTDRKEIFWRSKLSYLLSVDGGKLLRTRFRLLNHREIVHITDFTLQQFGQEILLIINELYDQVIRPAEREHAFSLFDTADGLLELHHDGWILANHSAAHYPVGEHRALHLLRDQFDECDVWLRQVFGSGSKYWVLPFDRNTDPAAIRAIREAGPEKIVVRVGGKINISSGYHNEHVLYRITAPTKTRDLREVLFRAQKISYRPKWKNSPFFSSFYDTLIKGKK